jgi:hypothetical protein
VGSLAKKALLARFAKTAGAGEMLNIHDLKAAYEKAIGHATSDSTVYNAMTSAAFAPITRETPNCRTVYSMPHDLRDHMGGVGGTRGRMQRSDCLQVNNFDLTFIYHL